MKKKLDNKLQKNVVDNTEYISEATPHKNGSSTSNYHLSQTLYKLDEQNLRDTAG